MKLSVDLPTRNHRMEELFDIISQNNWKDTLVGKFNKTDISKELISGWA